MECRASRLELLEFIKGNEIVTPQMLRNEFGYRLTDAYKKLNKLKKLKLAESIRDPSYGYKKTWCLTLKGDDRLDYLQRKSEEG